MGRTDLDLATEAFVRGFSAVRSVHYPYLCEQVEGVWVTRDAPRKNPRDYRREEWVACDVPPAEMKRVARLHTRGRFVICAILSNGGDEAKLRAEFKSLNFRLGATEPVMIHRLKKVPRFDSPATIQRIATPELADRFCKAWKLRALRQKLTDPNAGWRQYVALDGEKVVGGVASIDAGDATWVSAMFVSKTHRRRGIGKAMLSRLLADDRRLGSKISVLTASHTGAMLYPQLGYEQVGLLFAYNPIR